MNRQGHGYRFMGVESVIHCPSMSDIAIILSIFNGLGGNPSDSCAECGIEEGSHRSTAEVASLETQDAASNVCTPPQ